MFLLLLGEALPAASFLDDSVCTFATQEADGAVIRLSSKIALWVCTFFSSCVDLLVNDLIPFYLFQVLIFYCSNVVTIDVATVVGADISPDASSILAVDEESSDFNLLLMS